MTDKNGTEGYIGHFFYDAASGLFRAELRPIGADALHAESLRPPCWSITPEGLSGHYSASSVDAVSAPAVPSYRYLGPEPDKPWVVQPPPAQRADADRGQPPGPEAKPPDPANGTNTG